MRAILRVVVVALLLSITTAATPPIAIDIQYRVMNAPGYFRVRVTVEPAAENRWACLYANPQTSGDRISHCWSLNGELEPRTFWRELKTLPVGRYDITAEVIRNDDHHTLSNAVHIVVLGVGYEPEPDTP